ncbi:MAG TPA: CHAT domain-containing protein, partial [Thermoanaerobaculia bacterium]
GRWERAQAVTRLDAQLSALARDERLDAGMFLRKAVIEHRLLNTRSAHLAIATARDAADCSSDADVRSKLIADIDGAAGTIMRAQEPQGAVELLTAAIDYQHRAQRPIVLPELYLQRGRAHLALDKLHAAASDFDRGIAELERQRTHVSEAAMRPGLFDDAAELFEEAIALQLRRDGVTEKVLAYVERGRARALLEQMGAGVQRPAKLADVQRHLGTRAAVIEYVSLPDRIVIISIARNRAVVRSVTTTRAMLRDATGDGERLYDLLIRPIEFELRGIDTITFVPDDVLQRVAFGALLDRTTRTFLVQRQTVAVAPSAGVFVFTSQRDAPGMPPTSALVLANPTIPRDTFPDLRSLGASEREASRIARSYTRAEILKRDDATAERFLKLAPEFEVVHFAGHAVVRNSEPGASALVCASSPEVHGALTQRQIAEMRFPKTQVVVLAACSTMRGRNAAIEGVPSLARAFVVAGVPAVVGTLWDIDDAKATPLMRVLHEELAKGIAAPDALRAAQLKAIALGQPVEEWAAFAVTGIAR